MSDASLAVCLNDIRFRWPNASRDTLHIPDFSMHKGERVFISGPSGSGKSTLLGIIAGILTPNAGTVHVNGVCLNDMDGAQRDSFRGEHIGFIFQQFNLVPYLSILENITLPCQFSATRCTRVLQEFSTLQDAAIHLLKRLDLAPTLWNKAVHELSIGQQQRVAAARALIGRPELIIADEPTSALDADRRQAFLQLLLEECTTQASTLLFVSHDTELSSAFPRIVRLAEVNHAHSSEPL